MTEPHNVTTMLSTSAKAPDKSQEQTSEPAPTALPELSKLTGTGRSRENLVSHLDHGQCERRGYRETREVLLSTARVSGPSHSEAILDPGLALNVRREAGALVGKIARSVIAVRRGVVGEVEDATRTVGAVGFGGVRRIAVE